jgi:hypothetical protein
VVHSQPAAATTQDNMNGTRLRQCAAGEELVLSKLTC